jgi:hypothetical protein
MTRACALLMPMTLSWAAAAEPVVANQRASSVQPGQPFEYRVDITWDGPGDAYSVYPADWEDVEGLWMSPVRMESRIVDGQPVISQVFSVVVEEAGKIDLPQLTVSFATTQEGNGSPEDTSSTHPKTPQPSTLTVPPFPVEARPYRPLAWFFGALATILLLCLGLGWRLASPHRSRQSQSPSLDSTPTHNPAETLMAARRARHEGDLYAFYRHLSQALAGRTGVDPALFERIQQRTADVGYRGAKPNNDLLDGDFRDVARAVGDPKEDAAA